MVEAPKSLPNDFPMQINGELFKFDKTVAGQTFMYKIMAVS